MTGEVKYLFRRTTPKKDFAKLSKLIYGWPKSGKCLGFGTPVMMADGTTKPVEDIKAGEFVMGNNGKPTMVSGVTRGQGPLYRVSQNKGATYVVNEDHVLSLSYRNKRVNLPVKEYLALNHGSQIKHKGVKSPLRHFEPREVRIDPYFLGLWLGDGTSANVGITNPEPEIHQAIYDYASRCGLRVSVHQEDRCPTMRVVGNERGDSNPLLDAFRFYNLIENKHIPRAYLINDEPTRAAVLAGLIDTDGHNNNGKCIEIVTKFDKLSDDILWLARSLGFRATHRMKRGEIKELNFEHYYHRIFLAGDFTKLPMKLNRKVPRHQNARNPLHTGIRVERIPNGPWAGFCVDAEDHLFLLGDFTVTHNSTLAAQQKDADGREPLFITSEDGHDALEVFAQKVTSWGGLVKLTEDIIKNTETIKQQHSCFVLDLVSDFDVMCTEAVARKNNVVHLADLDFGKGWHLQKQEFQRVIKELMAILPCTFIAHSTDKELMWNNEKIKLQAPSLSKGSLEFINGKVDVIAWMTPANNKKEYPEVVMKNTLTSIAGSRHRQLCRSFTFYPENPAKTYAEIQKAFANEKEVSVESKNPSPQRAGAQTQADATTA